MKKFTSLLIGVSLALAGAAFAQQPEEQSTPGPGKKQGTEKTQQAEPKAPKTRGANLASPEATVSKQTGATNEPGAGKGRKAKATEKSATSPGTETNVTGQPSASATPTGKHQRGEKGMKGTGINARTSPSATPAAAATASAAPSVAATGQQTAGGNAAVKADPQKVQQVKQQAQQIKQQHANFRAQPRPDKVPAVTFNASYRIQGS